MKRVNFFLLFFTIILQQCTNQEIIESSSYTGEVAIPYLPKRSIARGIEVKLYSNKQGKSVTKEDLNVEFTVGWDEAELFFIFTIDDDSILVDERSVWKSDAVEIFVTDSFGSNNMIQYTVSYFPDDTFRCIVGDYRSKRGLRKELPEKRCSVFLTPKGYSVTISIKLKDLGFIPKENDIIGLQVYVRDVDKKNGEDVITYSWHNGSQTYLTPLNMYPVRLVKFYQNPPDMDVKCYLKDMNTFVIIATGDTALTGKTLQVDDKKEPFKIVNDYAQAQIMLPFKNSDIIRDVYVHDSLITVLNMFASPLEFSTVNKILKFENEVRYFEMMDFLSPPPDSVFLFAGSSSFRRWNTLQEDMQGLNVLNRGFGGSTMQYLLYYFPRLVGKYKPAKILVYEGDNDIPYGLSPSGFNKQCREFIKKVEKELPGTEIYFLSIKPSPARWKYQDKYVEANKLLKSLCDEYAFVTYIDIATMMLDENGIVRKDIFSYDNLHLNDEGYSIWRDEILKVLKP